MPELNDQAKDELALTVLQRYRRSRDYRKSHVVFQGKSAQTLMERAKRQYEREYDSADAAALTEAFGFCPSRYYGVVQSKVDATARWKKDLVVTSLDAMFEINPTPEPDIDEMTRLRIREGIRRELLQRMADVGVADPSLLLDPNGRVNPRVEQFLQEQAQALKEVEQARIVSAASAAAAKTQRRMRDMVLEGGFRQAYIGYSFDQILYGRGVMRFPHWQPQLVRRHTSGGGMTRRWEKVPTFSHINVFEFFPIDDGPDLLSNTGNTQRTAITKAELIKLAKDSRSGYDSRAISELLEDYAWKSRNWLEPDDSGAGQDNVWWGLDETIPMLIHEGLFTGGELADMGITGVDRLDFRNARVEIVGGYTVKTELIESTRHAGRTYFQAPYSKIGLGLYDAIGLAATLWDTEQRVNRLWHLFESNVDWATRPPVMRNKAAFDDPNDAARVVPGAQYDVEERFAVSGTMPDALRTMNTVSAQYHLVMTQINTLLRQADDESGIPAYAYTGAGLGQASLGEFSQRMSNALRSIKDLALNEDVYLIEPTFENLFDYLMQEDPELRVGQDVNIVVRGMSGLLKEDIRKQRQAAIFPLVMQGADAGIVPEQVREYVVKDMLDSAGVPTDQLGMSDPIIDNALAVAAGQPVASSMPATPAVPQLDGRSGAQAMQNVANSQPLNPQNLAQVAPVS